MWINNENSELTCQHSFNQLIISLPIETPSILYSPINVTVLMTNKLCSRNRSLHYNQIIHHSFRS